jgi:hypothetical protein
MKPPVCLLCGKFAGEESPTNRGDWVVFADYDPHHEPSLMHPDGLEYYCDEHVEAAKAQSLKTSSEALLELQKQFGTVFEGPRRKPTSWWKRFLMSQG